MLVRDREKAREQNDGTYQDKRTKENTENNAMKEK